MEYVGRCMVCPHPHEVTITIEDPTVMEEPKLDEKVVEK